MGLFQLARLWVLMAHATACSFALSVAALHVYFLLVPYVGDKSTQLDPTIPSYFVPTIVGAGLSCLGHLVLMAHTITHTARARWRTRVSIEPTTTMRAVGPKAAGPTAHTTETHGKWRRVASRLAQHKAAVLRTWTRHQAELTRLFILWEVALQTFQAHKISQLITSQWINRLMVTIIVSNCWFSPILHFFLGSRTQAFVRLHRLVIDSALDMAYNIGIPLTIFYPYYRDFDGSMSVFSAFLYFTDTWYINAISELRQLFVTSPLDLVSKFTGALGLQYRLYTLLNAVNAAQREDDVRISQRTLVAPPRVIKSRLTRLLDVLLLVWGAAVLALHTHAAVTSSTNRNVGCLLEMRPWGSSQYTCAALEVSCSQWRTRGDKATLHEVLSMVDPTSVQILILSNCPDLHVPPALQQLERLVILKIYNATVAEWDIDAALTSTHHPFLQSLYVTRVNMTAMPPGLLADNFPTSLWGIIFCRSNLNDFPDRIADVWGSIFLLAVEGNPALDEIPRGILKLPGLDALGLRHNNIQSIPDDALADASLLLFDVAGNPLTELPQSIGSFSKLQAIDLRHTRVGHIPSSWSAPPELPNPSPSILLHAGGSPLCDPAVRTEAGSRSVPWLTVDCTPVAADEVGFAYPIDDEDEWRRANQ